MNMGNVTDDQIEGLIRERREERLNADDLSLLIMALAAAASRHESQARVRKWKSREHDEIAAKMRALRMRLVKQRLDRMHDADDPA